MGAPPHPRATGCPPARVRCASWAPWTLALAVALAALLGGGPASAARLVPEPDPLDADDPLISEDLSTTDVELTTAGPDDEDLVLAARKSRTTVQEAPSIIYVITKEQIAERGYRTIDDVLRTVPGFEGDRWEGNGWERTSFSRGIPHGVLVLWNGVNIVEPLRNYASLDRKIPLEIVERIEVTSGPGGVLWGSNALLGVVNIVSKHAEGRGLSAVVGAGDGPGDRLALKAGLGYDVRLGADVGLLLYVDFFSSMGPELRLDAQKVIGSLPEPADDSPTVYIPEAVTLSSGQRDWFLNFAGRLELGPVALDWMIPFEKDHRALATGGAPLRVNFLDPSQQGAASTSSDSIRVLQLSYRDRFAHDKVGLLARAYVAQWLVRDDPFGVYPASPVVLANLGYQQDLRLKLIGDLIVRPGAAVDVDYRVTDDLELLAGAELFFDINRGVDQTSWAAAVGDGCPPGFTYDPYDTHLPCRIVDRLIDDVTRAVGGGFVQANWRVLPELALSGGARLQASSQFDPALLWSGGVVWRVADRTHLKLFASTGLRPPGTASTNVRDTTSAITFKANPNLNAETSRSFELEANTMLLRDAGVVRDLYLRANASYTLMDNVIGRPGGRFENSGQLDIIGAEAYGRLRFQSGPEVWANYTYTQVLDDHQPNGQLDNIAHHMLNLGGKVGFLDGHIELMGLLTFKSAMVDPNRPPLVDPSRPDYSQSCANVLASGVASDDPLRQICSFPTLSGAVIVMPGQVVRETIDPVLLLDLGVRFRNIWRDLTVSVFVHNALDYRYYEPDLFGDPRVISRPQPKPGMSFFGQISFGL